MLFAGIDEAEDALGEGGSLVVSGAPAAEQVGIAELAGIPDALAEAIETALEIEEEFTGSGRGFVLRVFEAAGGVVELSGQMAHAILQVFHKAVLPASGARLQQRYFG